MGEGWKTCVFRTVAGQTKRDLALNFTKRITDTVYDENDVSGNGVKTVVGTSLQGHAR